MTDPVTAVRNLRNLKMSEEMGKLGTWATARSQRHHDAETSIAMLYRRIEEIISRVNRAGWDSLPNSPDHDG